MKRTALYIGFPYTAGLLAASMIGGAFCLILTAAVLLTAVILVCVRREIWKYVLISTLSLLTACCVYWQTDAQQVQKQLAFAGAEDTVFCGEVFSVSVSENGYATYLLDGTLNDAIPARIRYFCDVPEYAHEDTLRLTGTPEAMQSSYVFDAQGYYRSQRIFLFMPMDVEVTHIPCTKPTLRTILYTWRTRMTENIRSQCDTETGALMTGMLFGDKSAMSGSTKTALYRTGIGHVLAVSGLHLDFLALLTAGFLKRLKADRRLSFAILAVLAVLFVICVGETVSVKRACIMILISQSAGLFFRKSDPLNSISIAMFLLALENPFVIHSAAFWLSFSGAYGIAVFAQYMTKPLPAKNWLQKQGKNAAAMCCVFLVVLPASMLYFREVSLISPISNLLVVPLCMAVLLLEILALPFGAQGVIAEFLLYIAEKITSVALQISDALARIPWTYAGTESDVMLCLLFFSGAFLIVCYFLWKKQRTILAGIILSGVILCMASGTERMLKADDLNIAMLGDGRDCVLVLHRGTDTVIVDFSGDAQAPDHVNAYLQSHGIRSVEAVFLCNPKPKNTRGYDESLQFTPPQQVMIMEMPEEETETPQIAGCTGMYAEKREMLFHGVLLTVTEETAAVHYNGFDYFCGRENTPDIPESDALTIYGTSKNILPDSGMLVVLDERSCYPADAHTYIGENDLVLTVSGTGQCRIRRLYADT